VAAAAARPGTRGEAVREAQFQGMDRYERRQNITCHRFNNKKAEFQPFCLLVEMSGIEPESERLDPRTSTSIAGVFVSPGGPQPAEISPWLTAGTRKPLFRKVSGVALAALRLCVARLCLRQEFGAGGRVLHYEDQLLILSLMQRGA